MPVEFQDIVIWVVCFIGFFVSVMYILTLLSSPRKNPRPDPKYKPRVSIIIPVWNEGSGKAEGLRKTIKSLLDCRYPKDKLEIIVVNDGSTDNSLQIAEEYRKFGIKIFSHRKPLGKTRAVNTGMKHATGEFVSALDADSFIMPDVIDKLVPHFKNPQVMAAIPSLKIWKPRSFLQQVQFQEFLSADFIRQLQSELGSVPLAPGAFTLIRKSFIDKYGSLDQNTMVEDLEISLRIQSKFFLIENVPDANVYTTGLNTLRGFISQRVRWFTGFMIQLKRYRHLLSRRYGNLGVFILPISIIYIILSLFLFVYAISLGTYNLVKFFFELKLVGFDFRHWFEFHFDSFFLTISNSTILPIFLLIIFLMFMYYIKKISEEKQSIIIPFISYILTYWFIGSYCWVVAIYYYMTKKKIRWGPNYYSR
jgi:biofilm PGA synthesis N-glycosyltransferase PgaC